MLSPRRHAAAARRRQRGGQRLDVELGDLALVLDVDVLDRGLGHLAGEGAELLGQRDEGLQARRFLGGDRGDVERVGDRAR